MGSDQLLSRLFQGTSRKLILLAAIGLAIFLFVLFFQPFPYEPSDFNDQLLIMAGLGLIVFLLLVLVRMVLPLWLLKKKDAGEKHVPQYLPGVIFLLLNSTAVAFYLRFVGWVDLSFYLMVRVVLISLAPPVILWIHDLLAELSRQNAELIHENQQLKEDMLVYHQTRPARTVTFISDNQSGSLNFEVDDILMFRSADNYVQVVYLDQHKMKKRLLRNTLKNIELQVEPFAGLVRCHRTCIVNLHYVTNLFRKNNSYWLNLRDYENPVPVSRQYLIRTREALSGAGANSIHP
jgi:DNA-binding LytR/AlgR family response regulator